MASRPGGIVVDGGGKKPPNKQSTGDDDGTGKDNPNSEEKYPSWILGYEASTTESADSPNYPGNQIWQGVGASAETYKEDWKDIPPIFPYGRNFEGGK